MSVHNDVSGKSSAANDDDIRKAAERLVGLSSWARPSINFDRSKDVNTMVTHIKDHGDLGEIARRMSQAGRCFRRELAEAAKVTLSRTGAIENPRLSGAYNIIAEINNKKRGMSYGLGGANTLF